MAYRTIEKPEEKRVFFEISPQKPREGDEPVALTYERETAEALIAKQTWEAKHPGLMLLHFHKDPMAGGSERHSGGGNMISYPMWVGEWTERQYKGEGNG